MGSEICVLEERPGMSKISTILEEKTLYLYGEDPTPYGSIVTVYTPRQLHP